MYVKFIASGNYFEQYSYEQEPSRLPRKKSKRANARRLVKNVRRARTTFFRLVKTNLSRPTSPALLTLTMREVVGIREAYKAFTRFTKKLRYHYTDLVFISVPEFQKRGAVHFHVLVWGFDYEQITFERTTRRIANLWGHGFVDITPTDGSPRLAGYLTKYMSKTMWDERLFQQKSYSVSRNVLRPLSITNQGTIALYKKAFQLSPVNILTKRSYLTKWLGRCRLIIYETTNKHARNN